MNQGYEIIAIEDKEYVIIEKISVEGKQYFLLNELVHNTLTNNRLILRESEGFLYPLEEEEKRKITEFILKK